MVETPNTLADPAASPFASRQWIQRPLRWRRGLSWILSTSCLIHTAAATPAAVNTTLLSTQNNATFSGKLMLAADPPTIGTTDFPIAYQVQMGNRIPPALHIDPHEAPITLTGLPLPADAEAHAIAQAVVTCKSVELWKVVNPMSPIVSVLGTGHQCKVEKIAYEK